MFGNYVEYGNSESLHHLVSIVNFTRFVPAFCTWFFYCIYCTLCRNKHLKKKKYLFLSWPRRTCFARAPETREIAASVDDGTDWAIVRRRSVILSGKKEGKPYVREDFTDSLGSIIESVKET